MGAAATYPTWLTRTKAVAAPGAAAAATPAGDATTVNAARIATTATIASDRHAAARDTLRILIVSPL